MGSGPTTANPYAKGKPVYDVQSGGWVVPPDDESAEGVPEEDRTRLRQRNRMMSSLGQHPLDRQEEISPYGRPWIGE